jgi:cell division protein FtsN
MKSAGRGGFAVGFVVGLLIGLAIALGVALYVSKVPVPFVNKVPQRTAEQDAAEAERNKGWDPNAGLTGKPATRPPAPAPAPAPASPAAPPAAAASSAPRPSAAAASAAAGTEALMYFAQAGAYTRTEDADAQRAKLALQGFDAKISEREQSGRTVYRVRIGPFRARADAEQAVEQLKALGVDAALVRVQRP